MPEHQQIQQSKKMNTIFQKQATYVSQTPVSNHYSIIQRAKINPKSLTHADIMQLQRTIGNQAVGRLLLSIGSSSTVQQTTVQRQEIPEEEEKPMQGKFETVQRSETPEEEEPLQGKMVGTVQRQEIPEKEEPPMQGKFESIQCQEIPEEEDPLQGKFENKPEISCPSCFAAPIMQRREIPGEEEPLQGKMGETVQHQEIPKEEEPLQGKIIGTIQRQEIPEEEEPLQGKMIGTVQRQEIPEEEESLQGNMIGTIQRQEIPEEEEPLQKKSENNTGMPDNLKAGVESLSGIDMSDVMVHYNSDRPAKASALAYTQGTDIHVAPGQERHLPHEAWHVVQQKQEHVKPTMQLKDGVQINDDQGLEHEADVMGENSILMNNNKGKQLVQTKVSSTCLIQLQTKNMVVTGLSHLVQIEGNSIFRGQETDQIEQGQELIIETRGAKRSRRGPNQELYRDDDKKRETHIYKWYRVLKINGIAVAPGIFVREDVIQDFPRGLGGHETKIGYKGNTAPDIQAVPNVRNAYYRTPEARDMDRLARAYWLSIQSTKKVPFSRLTPHIAVTPIEERLHLRSNTGERQVELESYKDAFQSFVHERDMFLGDRPEQIRKRRNMKKKLIAQSHGHYTPPDVVDGRLRKMVGSSVSNPSEMQLEQTLEKTDDKHAEICLQDTLVSRIPPRYLEAGTKRKRLQQQHISGVRLDCLLCHWAHAIFNLTYGKKLGIQLTSSGTSGEVPAKWKAPEWFEIDPDAKEMMIIKARGLSENYRVQIKWPNFIIDKKVEKDKEKEGEKQKLHEKSKDPFPDDSGDESECME